MRGSGGDGFTLIEALVAFAIVATATLVLQRSLVQSRAAVGAAAVRVAPEWLARSLLAEPLSDFDIAAGGRTGIEGGRRFQVRVAPVTDWDDDRALPRDRAADRTERQVRWLPMRVTIAVEADRAQWLTVETIKLGRVVADKPPAGGG